MVRSRNSGCLVTWFFYQLMAKPGSNTAAVSWPNPYVSNAKLRNSNHSNISIWCNPMTSDIEVAGVPWFSYLLCVIKSCANFFIQSRGVVASNGILCRLFLYCFKEKPVVTVCSPLFCLRHRWINGYIFGSWLHFFTQLPLDRMSAITWAIFWDEFSWMKSFVFWLRFHLSLFLRIQLTITQHWFR